MERSSSDEVMIAIEVMRKYMTGMGYSKFTLELHKESDGVRVGFKFSAGE